MTERVGLVTHPTSFVHDAGAGHPERGERIGAILSHLESCGLADRLERHEPQQAPLGAVGLVHRPELVDLLERIDAAGGGRVDIDTRMGPGSLAAALCAGQGAIDAVERVLDRTWGAAFVCTRPPGHHATPTRSMGFCLTNHVAVAARWATSTGRAARVLVVDWDAHHGNGTQEIFWEDPSVLYVSVHQYPWYPGTGDATETGGGPGRGYTLNVPLPAGTAEDAYERALEELVGPVARSFAPDLVLVSAGYDAHALDPLCMMRLTAGAYFRLARSVKGLGPGPVCVLEGGYHLDAIAWSVAATVSALLGMESPRGVPADQEIGLAGEPEAQRWLTRARDLWERGRA